MQGAPAARREQPREPRPCRCHRRRSPGSSPPRCHLARAAAQTPRSSAGVEQGQQLRGEKGAAAGETSPGWGWSKVAQPSPLLLGKQRGFWGAAGPTHPASPCRNAAEEAPRSRCQRQVVAEAARLLTDPLPSLSPAPCSGQVFFFSTRPFCHFSITHRRGVFFPQSWKIPAGCWGLASTGEVEGAEGEHPPVPGRGHSAAPGAASNTWVCTTRLATPGSKKKAPPSRPNLLLLLPALPSPCPPSRPGCRTPTVIEEEQHGKSQRGGGQEDEADVAGDHEVPHHQGDLVLVQPVPLQGPRCHGVLASRHAGPSRRGPKLNPPATHPRQSSHQAHADALRPRFFASFKPRASPGVPILQEQEGEEARRRLQQQACGPTLAIPAPSALPREPCAPLLSNPPPSSRGGVDPRVPRGSSRLSSAELKCQELNLRCRDGDGVAPGSWGGTPRHPRL